MPRTPRIIRAAPASGAIFDLLAFVSGVLGNVLLLTVVGADALLRVLRSAHDVSRAFHNGQLAAALEEKLAALDPSAEDRRLS